MKNVKKWLAILLILCLMLNLIPFSVLAQEPAQNETETTLTENTETTDNSGMESGSESSSDPVADPSQESSTGEITETPDEGTQTDTPEAAAEETQNTVENTQSAVQPTEEENGSTEVVNAVSAFSDTFANEFAAVLRENGYSDEDIGKLIIENNDTITLNVRDGKVLELLSQQNASGYQKWILNLASTGNLNLGESFNGLGSSNCPFEGELNGSVGSVMTKHTLFNALSSKATLISVPIKWAGSQNQAIFAEKLVLDADGKYSNGDYAIPMSLSFDQNDKGGFNPFIGTVSKTFDADITVVLPALDYTNADPQLSIESTNDDLGLLCCHLGENIILSVSDLRLPSDTRFQFKSSANTGGLIGSMGNNSKLTISQKLTLNALLIGGNSSGGLVGSMETGAVIDFEGEAGVDISAELKADNAGGIAGVVNTASGPLNPSDAVITPSNTETNASAENAVESANEESSENSPSGSSGLMMTLASLFSNDEPAVQETPLMNVRIRSVKANGTGNAGVLYGTCTATGEGFKPLNGVSFTNDAVREVSGQQNCGGIFGTLTLNSDGKCSIVGANDANIPISSTLKLSNNISGASETGNSTMYGGVAGTMNGNARKNALIVKYCDLESTISVGNNTTNYPKYLGGIIAKQQTATLDTANSTITVKNPTTIKATDYGFGGVCAYLDIETLLIADSMKVVTDSFTLNPGGGGIAGSTHEGSIVYLKNSLDLSECLLTTNATSGQIVGNQESSLIYAPSVKITRLQKDKYNGMELDDIGNYGEMYRIAGLLEVGDNYNCSFSQPLRKTNVNKLEESAEGSEGGSEGEIGTGAEVTQGTESVEGTEGTQSAVTSEETGVSQVAEAAASGEADQGYYGLSDALDYACLALAWQSRGNFPTVDGINNTNWDTLKSCNITLNDNIILTGFGIGGLTRDVYSSHDVFSGIFNGNHKTLTLDIGADNQANSSKVSSGDGRIYWHNATGLFAVLKGNAQVKDLTLRGSVRISNNKLTSASNAMKSGAIAALFTGTGTETSIINVSTEVAYDAVANGGYPLYIGGLVGLIGYIDTSTNAVLDLSGNTLAANISVKHSENGSFNHIGGAVGGIDGKSSFSITCQNTKIGGSITSNGNVNNLYAGGIVGTVLPASGCNRRIDIQTLTVDGFTLSGNASDRMGGILGGIWADTNVTVEGLSVTNSTLTSTGTAELGGLVYRAGGKWTVNSADLSGLTLAANNSTKALGIMVCHGDPYKEPINSSSANSNMNALYLEMTEHWGTAYNVPTINNFGSGVFDEFVAYTAYANRADNTPNYDITHNGGGIISLKTENGTVNMTEGNRNTYVNRTDAGQNNQTNKYSRYYYNLNTIMSGLNGTDDKINTAEELLIWSVFRYADSTLSKYFTVKGITDLRNVNTIGGTDSVNRANFNMNGLSYYPIDISNENVSVNNADVKFYNNLIETKENGNKQTQGSDDNHSQHYMMHCGLFHDFESENISKTENYSLKVNGVSFSGSIGVVNGGSGALICGTVAGQSISGNTSICRVTLSDSDNNDKAITLNGITVAPEGDYTPVLINKIGDYTSLDARYVVTENYTDATVAGSSLIGDVGDENANKVSVSFSGTIKLPEKENGVFTKATLLNSLRYKNGSAVYNFPKEKDYDNGNYVHNATHGKELGAGISVEYVYDNGDSKLGKYQASGEYVTKDSSFSVPNVFSNDLPYVAFSPATKDDNHTLENYWHELAVNVPSKDLIKGCGTYGHPYVVTTDTFLAAANIINGGEVVEGWSVCVPNNTGDTKYDSSSNPADLKLTYTNGKWMDENGTTHSINIREHLQSAYYMLESDIVLGNFNGIGATPDTAFKGVICGNNHTITLTGGSSAFIKYSYGSVVKDVTFILNQTPTLNRKLWSRGKPEQAPDTFFGGVIGCVLGGDNIIDDVKVETASSFGLNLTGTNTHLIPVGGYVGVVAGGGVLFRGECSKSTGITGTGAQLYRNPIIGRVLGGYALYEGEHDAPDNSDKNYTINTLTPRSDDLSWNGSTLTVNSAQGLLVLSAIVSSGAGSVDSNAYKNGLARNASYNAIGAESKPDDYDIASKDANPVWSNNNTPYLLTKYASYTGDSSICTSGTTGIIIKFKNDDIDNPITFDMSGYGNGYRGLSARYVSNAAFNKSTVTPSMVVLRVKSFDGQNAIVQNIDMNVKEYDTDDFHAASVGGIFNIVWTQEKSGGGGDGSNFAQNLTLRDCNVALQYVNDSGQSANQADSNLFTAADGLYSVSVGGFIGMANDIDATTNSQKTVSHNYLFTAIHIEGTDSNNKCKISGPNGAGGLIGTTAMASTKLTGYPGKLLANGKWALFGPSFLNCSYKYIEVTGILAAGGLIGDAYASGSGTDTGFSGLGVSYDDGAFKCYASCTVTHENLVVGQDSTITARAKGSIAAGIFGAAGMRVSFNDPDVSSASKTNLKINGTIHTLQLSRVNVLVSQEDIDCGSNPDGNVKYAYASSIIARIGSVNPGYFYDIKIDGGKTESKLATDSFVGSIVGSGYTNSTITIQRCHINSNQVTGAYAGGFLGRGLGATSFILYMSDCSIIGSKVYGTQYSGGLLGSAASNYWLYNLLIKNTSITAKDSTKAGRLFGLMNINDANNDFKVYAAGVSVYANEPTVNVPEKEGYSAAGKSYIGYIAYADYAGTTTEMDGETSPYVTVNPNFTLNGVDKMMTGDAVGKIAVDNYNSVAARIWADQKTGATGKKNLVSYQNATTIANQNEEPTVSTFGQVQKYGDSEKEYTNFPVLVLKGGDATPIENYLNVITNGGYATARAKANGYITVENPKVYYYDKDTDKYSEATADQLSKDPASVIKTASNTFEVKTGSYDNTRNRFTLLEFKFKTTVNDSDKFYTVSIPVVVERELQYDFIATFHSGTVFNKSIYSGLTTHILESAGTPMTAYLSYRYNRKLNQYMEYDWQSYLDSEEGFKMLIGDKGIDKQLHFENGLPVGTQLLIIDCQDGNQAYQYEVTGAINDVNLSQFTSVCKNDKKLLSSIGVALGITSSENSNGKYKRTNSSENAMLLKDGKYYTLAEDTYTGTRYQLTVPDLNTNTPEENYYLVVTVPENDDPSFKLNGSLSSNLKWNVPTSGKQVHRKCPSTEDSREQTESTYQISSGYQQSLLTRPEEAATVPVDSPNDALTIDIEDTISFDKEQLYTADDKLFLKFTASLMSYKDENGKSKSTLKQFPNGTTGIVRFYVQDESGTYYVPDGDGWTTRNVVDENPPSAASYNWESDGGNIELLLSKDGQAALDLSGVRTAIKGSANEGIGKIKVTAKMNVNFGSQQILEDVIPASVNGAEAYAKLHYVSRLSTQNESLDYSIMRETAIDKLQYYRAVQENLTLSMDATTIDQLGINPLELVADYQTILDGKNASRIDTVAALEMVTTEQAQTILDKTQKIRFSLSLYRRNGESNGEKNYVSVPENEANKFMVVKWSNHEESGSTGWSWDIPKEEFAGFFNGTTFTIPLTAYVFTDPTEFANYKLEIEVSFLDEKGNSVADPPNVDRTDAYIVYTYACIKPTFYDPSINSNQN